MGRPKINDGLTRSQRYYAKNKDNPEFKERKRQGNQRHRDNGNYSRYTQNNRVSINANAARYRAKKLNQTPEMSKAEWLEIEGFYMYNDIMPGDWHVDHIYPISKGGLHHPNNLQILSGHDNISKGART